MLNNMSQLDDVLARFGNADYSPEFWERVRLRIIQEQKEYLEEERASIPTWQDFQKRYGVIND